MKYITTILPKSQMQYDITVSVEEVMETERRALNRISDTFEMDGFRTGKVPPDVVRKQISQERLFQETCFLVIEEKYAELVKTEGISVVGQPIVEIKKIATDNPLIFNARVAIYPTIHLPDYKKIAQAVMRQTRSVAEISEEEVQDMIRQILESRRKEVAVTRPAQKGDQVEIDFVSRINKVKIEGGDSRHYPFLLGKSHFADGFDDHLVGMCAGEKKTFSLVVSDDHKRPEIRGKQVDFEVKMNSVHEVTVPILDDTFVQSLGPVTSVDIFKEKVKAGLLQEKKARAREVLHLALIEAVAAETDIEIADVLIDQEVEKMCVELERKVGEHGLPFDAYLSSLKKTREELKKEIRAQGEKRVRISLVLGAIAQQEEVNVSPDEVSHRITQMRAQREENWYHATDKELLFRYISGIIRNEKVLSLLEASS